jgi:hypothetical protein
MLALELHLLGYFGFYENGDIVCTKIFISSNLLFSDDPGGVPVGAPNLDWWNLQT